MRIAKTSRLGRKNCELRYPIPELRKPQYRHANPREVERARCPRLARRTKVGLTYTLEPDHCPTRRDLAYLSDPLPGKSLPKKAPRQSVRRIQHDFTTNR
jgi:hypothetical protein